MSHELTQRANGSFEFAFAQGEGAAWHGLGQEVPADADINQWRTAAGMDWRVNRARVRFAPERLGPDALASNLHNMDGSVVLLRSDTKAPLAVVSDSYKVVQPAEVLDFFRDVLGQGGLAMSAAGTLQGGRRFWATAKIGEGAPLSVRDRIGAYLLLATSTDGSMATEARLTTIRVVCANTLGFARAEGRAAVRISHRSAFDASKVKLDMGLTTGAWAKFRTEITRLGNLSLARADAEEITAAVFADDEAQGARDKARETAGFEKVMALFGGAGKGARLDGVYGTRWGLVNAFTEYADHHTRARSAENRFLSAQWGAGDDLKRRAFDLIANPA